MSVHTPVRPVATPDDPTAALGPAGEWARWSVAVARLSSSHPGATGPAVDAVAAQPLALCRGALRTILRRHTSGLPRLPPGLPQAVPHRRTNPYCGFTADDLALPWRPRRESDVRAT